MTSANIYKDPKVKSTLNLTSVLVKQNRKKRPSKFPTFLWVTIFVLTSIITHYLSK